MFKATRPFKDSVTNYPKEPVLRIGRFVPPNAVNLAYYYNPTATDAEKVLTAEAPRNTIDHRVEEAYRYLFNQSSDDDDLFPGSVLYEDEEGYQGRLGRMYVNWYPEAHILIKNVTRIKEMIVIEKSEVIKMIEYSDEIGYSGNLFLDVVTYEVTKTKDVSTTEIIDREVFDYELNYRQIFGSYIKPDKIDAWTKEPTADASTMWPNMITIDFLKEIATEGNTTVQNFINTTANPFDEAIGVLQFTSLEFEPIYVGASADASESIAGEINGVASNLTDAKPDMTSTEALAVMKVKYEAIYDEATDTYDYTEINDFLVMAAARYETGTGSFAFTKIADAMASNGDVAVIMTSFKMKGEEAAGSNKWFEATYRYQTAEGGVSDGGSYEYNVTVNYAGLLKKTVTVIKEIAAEYKATCQYVGIARKVWYDYDGVAYYRGAVTKGNGVGNVNPEGDNEILMFSDDSGYLRRPVDVTDQNGEISTKNFYRVESDHIYLTDVFKENQGCFYKYQLKKPIYDYRGPDENGFYEGDAVKIFTSGLKDIPKGYVHNMKLVVAEYETIQETTDDFQLVSRQVPKRYNAELYTSFISSSTDTFKVIYNAFNDSDDENVALSSGITEDIYCCPFMIKNKDFIIEPVDVRARVNKIKLPAPRRIKDTRRYVTFTYTITAERKSDGKKITTSPRTVSILNRDYVVPAEYNKFDGRAMIVSPYSDGIQLSPLDLILYDQAASRVETVITSKDTGFVFSATITEIASGTRGGVNVNCNPDGSGYITAETTIETGFWNEELGTYTKKLSLDSPYIIENGYIYPGFKVKCMDTRFIKVQAPREEALVDSWYPMIQFGHYSQVLDQYGAHVKICYTMPEYDEQHFSTVYGAPYVDITKEKVTILNSHMVKTKYFPLHTEYELGVLKTIKLFKQIDAELFELTIQNISFSDGIILTEETISENDKIVCDYTYIEENFNYRGYWRNNSDFARIDLNPNKYHTYSDLNYTPSETKASKNLFNKVIYFFMRPTVVYEVAADNDSLIYDAETDEDIGTITLQNNKTLYHQIDSAIPESDLDIYIGSVYIRQNTSLQSTILIDSRTRGGGVLDSMKDSLRKELEPESDYYLDIGYYDGEPYQENGVVIIRLDNSLLQEFGGRFTQGDIEAKVKRWIGLGVYPIIEYVDSYSKKDMPQYNLIVENSYTNVSNETPEILLECILV